MGGGIDEWVEVVMDNFFSFVSLVCVRERERGDGTIKIDNEKREEKGTVCLGGGTRQGRSVKIINLEREKTNKNLDIIIAVIIIIIILVSFCITIHVLFSIFSSKAGSLLICFLKNLAIQRKKKQREV